MKTRIQNIYKNIEKKPDVILIKNSIEPFIDGNFFYVTDLKTGVFEGAAAILYPSGYVDLLVSELEAETAKRTKANIVVYKDEKDFYKILNKKISSMNNIGINFKGITLKKFLKIEEHLPKANFLDVSNSIEKARLIKDDNERINELVSGNIDIAEYNVNVTIDEIKNKEGIKLIKFPPLSTYIIGFDLRENGSYGFPDSENPTADVRVRKAIYHAINVYPIIENVKNGYAEPASQFLSPLIFGYNPNIERLNYNIVLAKNLLNESGYENGFEITLDYPSEWYDDQDICKEVITQLLELIDVKPNAMTVDDYFEKILSRNSSFYIIGWIPATGDGGEIFDYILRTVDQEGGIGTYNLGYYSNKKNRS